MIVVKVGGSEGIDLDAICRNLVSLAEQNQKWVLIHGGSHQTNQVAEKLGHPPQFVTSPSGYTSRHTDRATLEIFEMVYCGQINKGVVERLQKLGVNAIGLSGMDGRIWQGPRKKAIRVVENGKTRILRDSYTGIVKQVNTDLLQQLLELGYFPVLTPPAISEEGEAINVDGDRAAGATAMAFSAKTLLLLSNVPGVLQNFPDEASLISQVRYAEIDKVKDLAQGRMRMKILGAKEALDGGVQRVIIGDARQENPIDSALAGHGTLFQK